MHLQLAWVLRTVSSHSKAANVSDRVAHGNLMQRQYQLYETLLQQAQLPVYELPDAGVVEEGPLDGHTTTGPTGEMRAFVGH